jgi:hypothetical protein
MMRYAQILDAVSELRARYSIPKTNAADDECDDACENSVETITQMLMFSPDATHNMDRKLEKDCIQTVLRSMRW